MEPTPPIYKPAVQMPTPSPEYRSKVRRKKFLLIGLAILIALGLLVGAFLMFSKKAEAPANEAKSQTSTETETATSDPKTVRIVATGDMIPHDALNAAAKKADGTYDYFQFMQTMQPTFKKADVRFCNEAVLAAGPEFGITGYPVFNAPIEFGKDMQKVGCNVINTGSNHANDKGQAALEASRAKWDDIPDILAVAGTNRSEAEKNKISYFESKGVKFAFLSYTTYTNTSGATSYGLTMYNSELAKTQLQEARSKADVVMVSMRWGTEYSTGINASQTTQSQFLADNGADIILGHGPHFLEPVKVLKGLDGRDTIVWFSLGNFLNAQLEVESLVNGFAVMDVDVATKKVSLTGYLPAYVDYEWTAEQAARQDLLARKNFKMYLLEDAADAISKSQLKTTAAAQLERVTQLLNQHTTVKMLTSDTY
jgi:poly-gamma-glutamate synthesis protein (capsule biosynthesis protein)